jgi:peptidoglycan hydrolase-like protein with peptidoglycan-binding domain
MPVSATSSTRTASHRSVTQSPLLREGASGPSVSRLQHLLRSKGYRIEVDGLFGPKTAAAVRAYQHREGLQVDGVVGPQTWGSLGTRGTGGTSPSPSPAGTRTTTGYQNGRPVSVKLASIGGGKWLNARAAPQFLAMMKAARAAGVHLSVSSAFRTMDEQRYLYHLYQTGRGNLAARPGYSNHQMGLSVDIGGIGGYGTRAYNWLKHNAPRYGFVNDVGGEFWHWTYQR